MQRKSAANVRFQKTALVASPPTSTLLLPADKACTRPPVVESVVDDKDDDEFALDGSCSSDGDSRR